MTISARPTVLGAVLKRRIDDYRRELYRIPGCGQDQLALPRHRRQVERLFARNP